ncbi:aldehyde ferredoxin oxidoreductase family protein [Natranaerofaba carboxydovora]|uniref:aldehyde ferredoxin oxidoreductase family protein n=1 Tax=Natranaerofaba carboxydovora TaxID=2742683 RepID=UPI001F13BAC2|nr:aldehyde ferredoxin oxidoreductase family protein [Natranaerofaba carboxydovora]UMZ74559.1 putative oxidoreductase YdhV [Natranaerofaba carboxydovora]
MIEPLTRKVLKIDLEKETYEVEILSREVMEKYVGGKGLGAWLLYRESCNNGKMIHPLGYNNPLIFATGPLTGTRAPAMRGVIISTSPLTGGFVDSYFGGHFAQEVKYAGFDAVMVTGNAQKPIYLKIEDGHVEFRDGENLKGLDTFETKEKIREELNDNSYKTACIGPAGENQVPFSLVSCEYNRQAGRGGIGAVMGAKNLKAVAVKGTNMVSVKDKEKFKKAIDKAIGGLESSEEIEELSNFGTAPTMWFSHQEGLLPVNNYQKGTSEPKGISHIDQRDKLWLRHEGCASCPIACSKQGVIREGKRKGTKSDIVEYETSALMGANLGLTDVKELTYLVYLCDALGLDGMSMGGVLGFAMECYEKGIMKAEDFDGIELSFGSAENLEKAIIDTAGVEGKLGKLLSTGVSRASKKLNTKSKEFACHVKGMEFPAFEPRSSPGMGLAYLTADRGACHQRAFPINYEVGGELFDGEEIERTGTNKKAEIVIDDQDYLAALDTMVKCDFGSFGISEDAYLELYEAATGDEMSSERLKEIGERIWNTTRMFNVMQGIDYKKEKLPKRFYEQIPDGPVKGNKFTEEDEEKMLQEYYRLRGWNEQGHPTEEKLKELKINI